MPSHPADVKTEALDLIDRGISVEGLSRLLGGLVSPRTLRRWTKARREAAVADGRPGDSLRKL